MKSDTYLNRTRTAILPRLHNGKHILPTDQARRYSGGLQSNQRVPKSQQRIYTHAHEERTYQNNSEELRKHEENPENESFFLTFQGSILV